jgi:prepilin-type N-terminal cleavage/methylation domain-containing protein
MREHLKSEAGFTIIELLVTIVILMILAAMIIPVMAAHRDQAREPAAEPAKTTAVRPADR